MNICPFQGYEDFDRLTPKMFLLIIIDKKHSEPQDSQKIQIENFYEAASQFAKFCEAVKT